MKSLPWCLLTIVGIVSLATISTSNAGELTKVCYPNQQEAAFTILIPYDCNMIPQGEEGAENSFEG